MRASDSASTRRGVRTLPRGARSACQSSDACSSSPEPRLLHPTLQLDEAPGGQQVLDPARRVVRSVLPWILPEVAERLPGVAPCPRMASPGEDLKRAHLACPVTADDAHLVPARGGEVEIADDGETAASTGRPRTSREFIAMLLGIECVGSRDRTDIGFLLGATSWGRTWDDAGSMDRPVCSEEVPLAHVRSLSSRSAPVPRPGSASLRRTTFALVEAEGLDDGPPDHTEEIRRVVAAATRRRSRDAFREAAWRERHARVRLSRLPQGMNALHVPAAPRLSVRRPQPSPPRGPWRRLSPRSGGSPVDGNDGHPSHDTASGGSGSGSGFHR